MPPIAILSLGTGNELARVTGWGATYRGDSLVPFVRDVAEGRVVGVDSWLWQATPLEKDEMGYLQEPFSSSSVAGGGSGGGGGGGGGGDTGAGDDHSGSGGGGGGDGGGGGSGGGGGGIVDEDDSLATLVTGTGTGQKLGAGGDGGDVSHSSSYDSMLGGYFGNGGAAGWGSVMTLNNLIAPPPKTTTKPPLHPPPRNLPPRIQAKVVHSHHIYARLHSSVFLSPFTTNLKPRRVSLSQALS